VNQFEILEWIWALSPGEHIFIPKQLRKDGVATWEEGTALSKNGGALGTLLFQAFTDIREVDMYFSVMSFLHPQRNIANVARMQQLMWLDLDSLPNEGDAPLASLDEQGLPLPNIMWSTSEGHYQAVWKLDSPIPFELYQVAGKNFTDRVNGADKGGWSSTKVLRVPNTVNWKRGGRQGHVVTSSPNTTHSLTDLLSGDMPVYPEDLPDKLAMPSIPTRGQWHKRLGELWEMLPLSVRFNLINNPRTGPGYTRSEIIWDVATSLARAGVDRKDAFTLMWHAPWNKFVDRPRQLWRDVVSAYASHH
jgi:hypothetical protein